MKARFETQVPPVTAIPEDGNMVCIQIALNETPYSETDIDGNTSSGYEYDWNEFHINQDNVDLDDVREYPEDYMEYPLPTPSTEERITALEALMLENIGG